MENNSLWNINNLHESLMLDFLNEEHSVNKEYQAIGDDIYKHIINAKPGILDVNSYFYKVLNYSPSVDTFVSNCNIICYVGEENISSSFDYFTDKVNLNKDKKLIGITFKISVNSDKNNNKLPDYNDFMTNFCHEFQHAYRYWCIIVNNNGKLSNGEERLNTIELNKIAYIEEPSNLKFKNRNEKVFLSILLNTLHFCNNNEINTYSAELYEYIKQHTEINRYNAFENIENIPSYYGIKKLKEAIEIVDEFIKDKDFQETAFDVSTKIMNWNVKDGKKAVLCLRQFFSKKYELFQRQFFKILKKTLYDLGRFENKKINEIRKNMATSTQMYYLLKKYDVK